MADNDRQNAKPERAASSAQSEQPEARVESTPRCDEAEKVVRALIAAYLRPPVHISAHFNCM